MQGEEQEELRQFVSVAMEDRGEDGHKLFQGYSLEAVNPDIIQSEEDLMLLNLYYIVRFSDEFKSLDGKPQVLNDGVVDRDKNLVTRMSHDMQVSQNAMKIAARQAQMQKSKNPTKEIMLAQITGLGHDLGHTPFGHDGEVAFAKWLKAFNIRFTHEAYGAKIFENIIRKHVQTRKEIREELGFGIEDLQSYEDALLGNLSIITRGIANHSMYYSGRIYREFIPQKATRLADSISYTVSDLSDLLRGDVEGVDAARLRNEYKKLGFSLPDDKSGEKFEEVIRLLSKGGDSLRILHERLIDEVVNPDRVDSGATVVDDYKMLAVLDDVYPQRGFIQSRESYQDDIFQRLMDRDDSEDFYETAIEYYLYLKDMEKDEHGLDTNYPYYNNEYVRLFENRIIAKKNKYYKAIDFDTEISCEELAEFISDVDVQRALQSMMKKIEQNESKQTPLLMTLFAIQNKIQYQEILKNHPEQLNNDTKENQEKLTDMLEEVLKYACVAYYTPGRFCDENHRDALKLDEKALPGLPYRKVVGGTELTSWPLSYTLYRVQQMQNQDFETPERIEEAKKSIRAELGIREESIPDIKKLSSNYAHDAVLKALYMKSIFGFDGPTMFTPPSAALIKPADIKGLAKLTPEVFNTQNTSQYHTWTEVLTSLRPNDLRMRNGPSMDKASRPKKRTDIGSNAFRFKKHELEDEESTISSEEDGNGVSPNKNEDGDAR